MWLALSGRSGRGRKNRAALNVNEASLKYDRASISVACIPGDLSSLLHTGFVSRCGSGSGYQGVLEWKGGIIASVILFVVTDMFTATPTRQ